MEGIIIMYTVCIYQIIVLILVYYIESVMSIIPTDQEIESFGGEFVLQLDIEVGSLIAGFD